MAGRRHGRDARGSALRRAGVAGDGADTGAAVDVSSEVVDEITWYMREHKVSRADLASALGVPPGRVSQILSGGERITPRTLGCMLTALGARLEISLTPATEHAHG